MIIKFFTDKTVQNDYLLIKIKDYIKLREKGNNFSRWKEVFIDPGVYELTKNPFFSWEKDIDIKEFLNSLPKNHYFSADYPSDMNPPYKTKFLNKSWDNALLYCNHEKYIVTVQHPIYTTLRNKIILDELNFKRWFDRYNKLYIKSGILGLGNLCRIKRLTVTLRNILHYAITNSKHPRIYIYGLCLDAISYAEKMAIKNDIELLIDSTKWTRACNGKLKWSEGYNCTSKNRQKFFDVYIKELRNKGIKIE